MQCDYFTKYFSTKKTCVRPNTECKLCGGLLDLDNWIHRLFRESQGRWGSVPARGCKGGVPRSVGGWRTDVGGRRGTGLGLLDSQEGRLKVWQQERCGSYLLLFYSSISRQTDLKACCPYECYHFKILKRTILHNICHHCH